VAKKPDDSTREVRMSEIDEPDRKLPENLRGEIKRFHAEGEKIVNAFAAELNKAAVPELVYHYTDGAGVRGILESGTLRFGDIFYLNDPSELKHGVFGVLVPVPK
jgi:hypothetical protein